MPIAVFLTDIEGTTSSIAFVKDVLFPYAKERISAFVRERAGDPEVQSHIEAVAREVHTSDVGPVLEQWIDEDRKATPLKALQGMIWKRGYDDGSLKGHVYADAAAGLRRLHANGVRLAVYSSGSVSAQKQIFTNSVEGDLSPLFSAHFDTRVGPKREAGSYRAIAAELGVAPEAILFASDVEAELDAAASAGMRTIQVVRPEDGTVASSQHPTVPSFDAIDEVLS